MEIQHNGQQKKDKRTDLQNTPQKTKATQTPSKKQG
jgi:hypothetical protein